MIKLENGTKIHTEFRKGDRSLAPIVFCHGNGQNLTSGRALINFFSDIGHTTLCYDLPGHGFSEIYTSGEWIMEQFAATLEEILEKNNIKRPIIAAHSFGGMIALQYATNNPRNVDGLILLAVSASTPKIYAEYPKEELKLFLEELEKTSKKLFKKQEEYDFQQCKGFSDADIRTKSFNYTTPQAYFNNLHALEEYDIKEMLDCLEVPILIMLGSKDTFISREEVEYIRTKTKNSMLEILEGLEHNFLIQDPECMITRLKKNYSFLIRLNTFICCKTRFFM